MPACWRSARRCSRRRCRFDLTLTGLVGYTLAPDKALATVPFALITVASVRGPAIAAWSTDLMSPLPFAGSYAVVAALGVATVRLLAFAYREPPPPPAVSNPESQLPARPLGEIVRQPMFLAAFANNGIGNAVMMFVMRATPIAAVACNHTIAQGAQIIEWHPVGMYAPSLVSGWLLQRLGNPATLMARIGLSALSSVIALASTSLPAFYAALPGSQTQFSSALQAQAAQSPELRELQGWIADHLDADLSVGALAERVAMSPRNFARVFVRQVGQTPPRYVETQRVAAARRMLEQSERRLGGAHGRIRQRRRHAPGFPAAPAHHAERYRAAFRPQSTQTQMQAPAPQREPVNAAA